MPLRYTSWAASSGRTKQRYWSGPSADTSNLWLMVRTLSGWPASQPFGKAGSGGLSWASPSGAPARAHSRISGLSFGGRGRPVAAEPPPGSALHRGPLANEGDLLCGEAPLVGEGAVAGLGLPGRHDALFRHGGEQAGFLGGIRVGKEGKWRHLAGAMANRAVLIQNRRDVFVECGRRGIGFSDCAAQRAGSRMGDRPPGQYRVERVAQIELGGLQARLPEILHTIVDAPQIQHRAIGGKHDGFRSHGGAGVTGQNLPRVEQSGKAVSVFARVPPDFFVGNRGVALHRIEEHATRGVRLFDAVHLRRVAVAQGAIRGDEEEHYGARLGPLIRVVLDALGIAQGKLERGTR